MDLHGSRKKYVFLCILEHREIEGGEDYYGKQTIFLRAPYFTEFSIVVEK